MRGKGVRDRLVCFLKVAERRYRDVEHYSVSCSVALFSVLKNRIQREFNKRSLMKRKV